MRHRTSTIGVFVVMATLSAGGAMFAQERYVREIRLQLGFVEAAMEADGFAKTHDYKIEKLRGDGTDTFRITLNRNVKYRIVAVCDRDCGDIDLRLFDENNNEVAKDTARDDTPMVTITPKWTGRFRIHVRMYDCRVSPCYYGIGTFGR